MAPAETTRGRLLLPALTALLCFACSDQPFGTPKVQFAHQGQVHEGRLAFDAGGQDQSDAAVADTADPDSTGPHDLQDLADTQQEDVPGEAEGADSLPDSGTLTDTDVMTCQPQCEGMECGPDMCGATCGNCPNSAPVCVFGQCKKCKPDCAQKECGPDGCGGVCGTCPSMFTCLNGFCKAPLCQGSQQVFSETFSDCNQAAFEIIDANSDDYVTWWALPHPDDPQDCLLYLGDPLTMSYYTGFSVKVELLSPPITIPAGGAWKLTFDLQVDAEPVPLPEYPYDYDVLFLSVVNVTDGEETPLFSTKQVLNDTDGEFLLISLDFSKFSNKTVRLRFLFDTLDSTDNEYAGIRLDNLTLDSICPYCKGADCSDNDPCTTDECALFYNETNVGHCLHTPLEDCPEEL